MGLFDLEKHFAFYGAYHSNPVNIFIHMLFVWPIFFTSLVLLYFTPPIFTTSTVQLCCHTVLTFNFGFLLAMIYGIYYVGLDKKAGCLGALLCFLCWVGSSNLAHRLDFSCSWKVDSLFPFLKILFCSFFFQTCFVCNLSDWLMKMRLDEMLVD